MSLLRNKTGMGVIFLALFLISSFRIGDPVPDSTIIFRFRVYVHGEPFQLNKKYNNPFGEEFEINLLRFYAGKISLVDADGTKKTQPDKSYHLVDISDSSSTLFETRVQPGKYRELLFQLGVDSMDQNQGAQTGVLDPKKGMFWTWNSGYLSFKIEGSSAVSNQPAHMIAYHIGGYRSPYSTVSKIKLIPKTMFQTSIKKVLLVEIPLELDYFFDGRFALHIKEIPDCTTPGEMAGKISQNFTGVFTGMIITENP
jgi:hypothetical protein